MSQQTERQTPTKRSQQPGSPNLPNHPTYVPGYAGIPLARFLVDLFVRPTSYNWLLFARLLGGVALVLAAMIALGIIQTTGLLSWWSVVALAVIAVLAVVEYGLFRLRASSRQVRRRKHQ